ESARRKVLRQDAPPARGSQDAGVGDVGQNQGDLNSTVRARASVRDRHEVGAASRTQHAQSKYSVRNHRFVSNHRARFKTRTKRENPLPPNLPFPKQGLPLERGDSEGEQTNLPFLARDLAHTHTLPSPVE